MGIEIEKIAKAQFENKRNRKTNRLTSSLDTSEGLFPAKFIFCVPRQIFYLRRISIGDHCFHQTKTR